MMYIMLDDDLNLIITKPETLRRGDNLSKKLIFLVPQQACEVSTRDATLYCNLVRPDGLADVSILQRLEDPYNEKYDQYVLFVKARMTAEAGTAYLWLEIVAPTEDPGVSKSEASSECVIRIADKRDIDEYVDDEEVITALDQMRQEMNAGFDDVNDRIDQLDSEKADNVTWDPETGLLQLTSDGDPIGDPTPSTYAWDEIGGE